MTRPAYRWHLGAPFSDFDRAQASSFNTPLHLVIHNDTDRGREHDTDSAECWCAPTIETVPTSKPI